MRKKKNFIKPYFKFEDKRGSIKGIFNNYKIEEVNLIKSNPNTIRGKHYHKNTQEILYVIKGELELYFANLKNKNKIKKKILVKEGQTVIIRPYEYHWSFNKKKAQWMNFLTKRFKKRAPDIIT
tara:strand:+ start:606 stop:977 length:372 start_codon:yes stop_codon:yes gene_type:complete